MKGSDEDAVAQLFRAALAAGLYGPRRSRLLVGLSHDLVSRLPEFQQPAEQLRSDIEILIGLPPGDGGEPPLARWIANARRMTFEDRLQDTLAVQWGTAYEKWGLEVPTWCEPPDRGDGEGSLAVEGELGEGGSGSGSGAGRGDAIAWQHDGFGGWLLSIAILMSGLAATITVAAAMPATDQGFRTTKYAVSAFVALVGLVLVFRYRESFGRDLKWVVIGIFGFLTVGLSVAAVRNAPGEIEWPWMASPPVAASDAPQPGGSGGEMTPLQPDDRLCGGMICADGRICRQGQCVPTRVQKPTRPARLLSDWQTDAPPYCASDSDCTAAEECASFPPDIHRLKVCMVRCARGCPDGYVCCVPRYWTAGPWCIPETTRFFSVACM